MRRLKIWYLAALFLIVLSAVPLKVSQSTSTASAAAGPIYWGAYIDGSTYGLNDAPWNTQTIDLFESHAQKKISILHWGQPWWNCYGTTCGYQYFDSQKAQYDKMRSRGIIPLVDWASEDLKAPDPEYEQPKYALRTIIAGDHDAYIRTWAQQAKAWGHPFFLRFNWEMNGTWYPWSEKRNGNQPGEYAQAWRHVRDIFKQVGANNVTWVWCVNNLYTGSIPIEGLYPGDAYVDWTCVDGYNRGTNPLKSDSWKSFYTVFSPTYNALVALAPSKPIMIGETASTEYGGSKATWIRNAFTSTLPNSFPKIKAVLWFNWNDGGMDWVIESSATAQQAFAESINSSYYAQSEFANLSVSPILPLDQLYSSPTLTPPPPTATATLPPATNTPVPPTATATLPPATSTPIPPTATVLPPTATATQPAANDVHVRVNFQPAASTTPASFLPDTGLVFAARGNGFSYGWTADNSANAVQRNAVNSPNLQSDTFNHMQRNGSFTWEIALPNGSYQVSITAGDPSYYDSNYKIRAEGILLVSGKPTKNNRWISGSGVVNVSDGRLTITSDAAARNNKINFIQIDTSR